MKDLTELCKRVNLLRQMKDLTELTDVELQSKLDGHNRVGQALKTNAKKRELYLHHVTQWVEVNEEKKRRKK